MKKPEGETPDPTRTTEGCAAFLEAEDATTTNTTARTAGVSDVKVEKFSTLAARLLTAEAGLVKNNNRLKEVRQAVVKAAQQYHTSRYSLGEALHAYKDFFMEERGWMFAAKEIGAVLQCGERTIRNIVADYLRASKLPESVIAAAEEQGIDLAKRKNAPLLEVIKDGLAGNNTPTMPDAQQLVGKVLQMPAAAKANKTTKKQSKSAKSTTGDSFTRLTQDEEQRFGIRMKIRTALTNIGADRKLEELLAALEEEMYDAWGMTDPVTVTLNPHTSGLTIDGRMRVAA
jgi:hypothetical protein